MGHERWFRGQHDGQERPFDWLTLARQHGIPWQRAQELYERAMQHAHGAAPGRVQELYLELLEGARRDAARPSPGKVTRTMRLEAEQASRHGRGLSRSRTRHGPVTPGKVTLTSYLASRGESRSETIESGREHEPWPDGMTENQAWVDGAAEKAWPGLDLPFRAEMERLFGENLGGVQVELDGTLPRRAPAAAERDRIAFANAAPSKATVAHEVAHVLQYRRGSPRTAAQIGERGDPAEREARRAAADVLAGRSVRIRGTPTAQMHLQEPTETGEDEADHEITVVGHAVDFVRRGDGLEVEVMWYALLWQEGRDHRPLREGELPPQFTAPRLRATRLILRLEEHTGRRMLPAGRQALLERREIPLTQRDPYSYTAELSAADLRQWFGAGEWQAFLDGRPPNQPGADATTAEATPTVTVEEVLRHLAEGRWDVDDLAAQLTDGQMVTLSATDRVRLIDIVSSGFSVLNEDEHTIVRLFATTPPTQARAVRDQLGTELLRQLDDAIDFDDYRDYNGALRRLFFDSLTPEEAAEQMAGARVFPWANPGIIHSLWNVRFYYEECELHDDGKVHVSYWINLAMFGLRTETVQLDPFEMIAVRFFYPEEYAGAEEGQTVYMPAINLRSLHRHQFKGELQTAVDIGLLAAGGAGLFGAGTRLARALAALDLAVSAADLTVREFRHEIARTEHGRDFLAAWDVVSTLITAYGVARLAMHAPAAIRRLRSAFERFRSVSPSLPAETMRRIESEVDDVLRQADEAEAAAGAGTRPGQTSGADDAAETATGQHSTGSADTTDATRIDDTSDAASHTPESTPQATGPSLPAPLRRPAPRHSAARVNQRTVAKELNTVIEPGVDVAGDVAAINAGQATRVGGNFVIHGRTYGVHDGTLYPISGPGFHQLSRGAFKALGVLNELGNTARASEILGRMGISAPDRAAALRVFEVLP
jgi:hypothetical protein